MFWVVILQTLQSHKSEKRPKGRPKGTFLHIINREKVH